MNQLEWMLYFLIMFNVAFIGFVGIGAARQYKFAVRTVVVTFIVAFAYLVIMIPYAFYN